MSNINFFGSSHSVLPGAGDRSKMKKLFMTKGHRNSKASPTIEHPGEIVNATGRTLDRIVNEKEKVS
jgi:hypothetical protein